MLRASCCVDSVLPWDFWTLSWDSIVSWCQSVRKIIQTSMINWTIMAQIIPSHRPCHATRKLISISILFFNGYVFCHSILLIFASIIFIISVHVCLEITSLNHTRAAELKLETCCSWKHQPNNSTISFFYFILLSLEFTV